MTLNANLFITPLIVLLLVLWGYFHFRKRAKDNGIYHRYLVLTGALAFFFNWGWEVAQGFLYRDFEYDLEHILICGLASVADMLMVYLLLFGFGLIYRNFFWIRNLTGWRVFWLMLTGSIGAILSEWRHTWSGNWSYADTMPLLPGVEAGLSSVLQFTLLPVIIFWMVHKILNNK